MIFCPLGRSPRGRRNLYRGRRHVSVWGAISARAVEPAGAATGGNRQGGDLRAGGGTISYPWGSSSTTGRSPRGRRNPSPHRPSAGQGGAISARAEEPVNDLVRRVGTRGDLRAGGGTDAMSIKGREAEGRSPRGRRNLLSVHDELVIEGAISARAEEPSTERRASYLAGGDLRAGGGTQHRPRCRACSRGRSPRGRRNPLCARRDLDGTRAISARAEEPGVPQSSRSTSRGDLRAGGGTGASIPANASSEGRSPRGRRNLLTVWPDLLRSGAISARAEEPRLGDLGR